MLSIVVKLLAIYGTLKNFHYTPAGKSFFATHKEADHILEDLLDIVDKIQEEVLLGTTQPAIDWKLITEEASKEIIPLDVISVENVFEMLVKFQLELNNLSVENNRAFNAILDSTAEIIAQGVGFLWSTLPQNDILK